MHKCKILMQNYLTYTQNQIFLVYISRFFSAQTFIFCMLANAVFPFARFHILHLLSQMLRLEFHANQGGFKHHHWSTSSWLTAPPQPISQRGAVMSLLWASLLLMLSFVHLYRWKWITVSWNNLFPYRTLIYVSVYHCCKPARWSVNVKRVNW